MISAFPFRRPRFEKIPAFDEVHQACYIVKRIFFLHIRATLPPLQSKVNSRSNDE